MNGKLLGAGLLVLILASPAVARPIAAGAAGVAGSAEWTDTPVAREEAKARIALLQQQLSSEPSATLVLARWCVTYHLAPAPQIIARRVHGPPKRPPARVIRNLALKPGETVAYRRVQLLCGDRVLSDADNWYVPDRLTPAMNHLLDDTDTPFGVAVRSLHFERRTLSSKTLWTPETMAQSSHKLAIPEHLLRNEGLLISASGLPISQVVENYTVAILGAPP